MKSHILIISQYFYPETFRINDVCRSLRERGHKITVLTGIPNYPEGKFFKGYGLFRRKRETLDDGTEIIRLPIVSRGKSAIRLILNYYSFVISGTVFSRFSRIKPDFIFSNEVSPMTQVLVGSRLAKRKKVPHYIYIQDLWPDNLETVGGIHNRRVLDHYAKMSKKLYERSDVVFVTSPSFVETIRARMDTNRENVRYLPQYAEETESVDADTSDLLEKDTFDIAFAGNIGMAQGLEVLPKAAALLRGENVRFVMIGEGRAKASLLEQIEAAGVGDMFVWLGKKPSETVSAYLARCDAAFVSFSPTPLFEKTIPAKVQTYLSCAMPIIAAAGGETRRIIEEAGCGVSCDSGDEKALAEIIRKAKTLDLRELSKNAKEYCDKNFSKEKIIEYLDGFFEK